MGVSVGSDANQGLLLDAAIRRWMRVAVVAFAAIVVVVLLCILYRAAGAALQDLAFVTPAAVSIIGILVLAIGALTITVVRSVFMDRAAEHQAAKDKAQADGPAVSAASIEALKAVADALKGVIDGVRGGAR